MNVINSHSNIMKTITITTLLLACSISIFAQNGFDFSNPYIGFQTQIAKSSYTKDQPWDAKNSHTSKKHLHFGFRIKKNVELQIGLGYQKESDRPIVNKQEFSFQNPDSLSFISYPFELNTKTPFFTEQFIGEVNIQLNGDSMDIKEGEQFYVTNGKRMSFKYIYIPIRYTHLFFTKHRHNLFASIDFDTRVKISEREYVESFWADEHHTILSLDLPSCEINSKRFVSYDSIAKQNHIPKLAFSTNLELGYQFKMKKSALRFAAQYGVQLNRATYLEDESVHMKSFGWALTYNRNLKTKG